MCFAESIVFKEEMQIGHNSICTLTDEMSLVNQKVHLPRHSLTADPKQSTLSWHQEINAAWLLGITGQVNLLCKVETVVHGDHAATGSVRFQSSQSSVVANGLGLRHHAVVQRPLGLH